jgi:hypothetical protein
MAVPSRSIFALLLIAGSVVGGGYATAAGRPSVSMRLRPSTIYYRKPKPNATNVTGRTSSQRSGIRVALEARRWPFQGSFTTVATERTAHGGRFNFVQRPSRATQYRVSSAGSTSGMRTIYIYPGYENASCTWSGHGSRGSCTKGPTKSGHYTMHFSFDFVYPAAVFTKESGLTVFVYFAECFGCSGTPKTVQRQATVSQSRSSPNSAHVSISQQFSVRTGQTYRWYLAPCLQTTERSNGFGLPGSPGSHRCGNPSVPSRFFLHGRDLG